MLLTESTKTSARFEVQPVLGSTLSDAAHFLYTYARRDDGSPGERPVREDLRATETRLHHLLVENPLTTADSHHGLCIRDASGVITGLLLSFPAAFLAGDQRLAGLGSGGYFVEPQARTYGFYLFKKRLTVPGYSFFFSTTCNANSGALWKALRGCAVPSSDMEYILPVNLDKLLPAFLASRTSGAFVVAIARLFGRCASPVLQRLAWKSAKLILEPCQDWEKLAELSRRHRPRHLITADRSAEVLQWRYGRNAPNHPFDICVFRDARGNEGWFSLGTLSRGRQGQIRGCVLLDAVWPREAMSFRDIFSAIVRVGAASGADAIYVHPRPEVDARECSRWLIPWRLEGPKSFVINRNGATPLTVSALDLVSADGDGAF